MNKTVNINLANTFFHIDEEAYAKLRRYLEAIKRSFSGTSGSDEIISDIEARIAELFIEKMQNDRQVITQKEVDEVITVMGQPEDYMVDEDIFEDAPSSSSKAKSKGKKLYRNIDEKYIGGVCSGLEYYLGLDALWIRLIFLFLAIFTGFGFIAYILLWILVPEATTTSQKLDMRGEDINISNIERKVKEGFDDVAEKIKNVDYEAVGDKVKKGGKTIFDSLGDVILFLFKVFGKFIGVILIITGAASLIGLFIGMFTVSILDSVNIDGFNMYDLVNTTGIPIWLVSILGFFAFGIPFFFLLYLGLKIVVKNLKSIGLVTKLSLLGLWLIAVITLTVFGIKNGISHASTGSVSEEKELLIQPSDTLLISMNNSDEYNAVDNIHFGRMKLGYNDDEKKVLISKDVRFTVKKTRDSVMTIKVRKDADGSSYSNAREKARAIDYTYTTDANSLVLNDYLTTDASNKVMDQLIRITIYVPEGTVVRFESNAKYHLGYGMDYDRDLYQSDVVDYTWKMDDDGVLNCLDCPEEEEEDEDDGDDNAHIKIDENGIDIKAQDEDGSSFELKIDEDGVKVKADDSN